MAHKCCGSNEEHYTECPLFGAGFNGFTPFNISVPKQDICASHDCEKCICTQLIEVEKRVLAEVVAVIIKESCSFVESALKRRLLALLEKAGE